MPYAIEYFNLSEGHTEDELLKNLKEHEAIVKKYVKGWKGYKLYKHYYFGENRRRYQLWLEFEDFATFDRYLDAKFDEKIGKLIDDVDPSFYDIVEIDKHIDECVSEVYPKHERPSSTRK
jgi:hypothetical protein